MCVVHLIWHLSIVQIEIVHDLPAYVCSFALNTFRRISWETKKKKKQGENNVRAMMMHPEVEDAIFDKMLHSSVCLSMLPSLPEAAVLVR